MASYIYLASPYSHRDSLTVEGRYYLTQEAASKLLLAGHTIFSPILHWHDTATRLRLPTTAAFWRDYNQVMLGGAEELWVLTLHEWQDSIGVKEELLQAMEMSKPVSLIAWPDLARSSLPANELLQLTGNSEAG